MNVGPFYGKPFPVTEIVSLTKNWPDRRHSSKAAGLTLADRPIKFTPVDSPILLTESDHSTNLTKLSSPVEPISLIGFE